MTEDEAIRQSLLEFVDDPLGFVMWAFPWGTGKLKSPEPWQIDVLREIEKCSGLRETLRLACRSGHGVGKSALIAWVILWFISCRSNPAIVVTANTGSQLSTKTWRELSVWHKRLKHHAGWFEWTATKFCLKASPSTWAANAITWKKESAASFAGTHEQNVLIIMDEASEIPETIWTTAEGAMTTEGAIWIAFGNPTMTTGRFVDCFGKFKQLWKSMTVDSRSVSFVDKQWAQNIVDAYGEDHDITRVRVRGLPPRQNTDKLIATAHIEAARGRKCGAEVIQYAPKIIGVDSARYGGDQTVLALRQGQMCHELRKARGTTAMEIASMTATWYHEIGADAVIIDKGNLGASVYDLLLNQIGGVNVLGVDFGGSPDDKSRFANKRIEMWYRMMEWLRDGGCIPDDNELCDELEMPKKEYRISDGKMKLESKEEMAYSPDNADALACTFAFPVSKRADRGEMSVALAGMPVIEGFDPFAGMMAGRN